MVPIYAGEKHVIKHNIFLGNRVYTYDYLNTETLNQSYHKHANE